MKYAPITLILILFIIDDCYADVVFAEFDSFSGRQQEVTGDLGSNSFALTITNSSSGFNFDAQDSVFDNSSNTFINPSVYTPATSNLDFVEFEKPDSNSSDTTVTLSFDSPVTDIHFFINSFEDFLWDFSPTVSSVDLVSGNDQLQVAGAVARDVTGSNADGTASGTIRLNGTFDTIEFEWRRLSSDLDEGRLQFATTTAIPEPSSVSLLALGSIATCLWSRRRSRRRA